MRVVFMGSPDFAVPVLEELIKNDGFDVVAVVSQPDKLKGRKQELCPTPVSKSAIANDITLYRPAKLADSDVYDELVKLEPDAIVVVAYGQILKTNILELPKYGCINVHASLLPRWRGASPIQSAILAGDEVTGVTTMLMNEGLDTGDILLKEEIVIEANDTAETLFDKMAATSPGLLCKTLEGLEKGEITPIKQSDEGTCYAQKISKDMGSFSWDRDAAELDRLIRAMSPWPGAFTHLENNKTLKVFEASVVECSDDSIEPGTILEIDKKSVVVKTGKDALKIRDLQLSGKKRMAAPDYLRGAHLEVSDVIK